MVTRLNTKGIFQAYEINPQPCMPSPTQPLSISSISTVNSDVESDAEWIPNLELDSIKMHLHAESDDEQLSTDLEE